MKTLYEMITTSALPGTKRKITNIVEVLYKYLGSMASIDKFKPCPLTTHLIESVAAGAKVKLFLRPADDLTKTQDMAQALHKGYEEAKHLESPMKEIVVYATTADELRKKHYDVDLLFENGFAYHLDTLEIF